MKFSISQAKICDAVGIKSRMLVYAKTRRNEDILPAISAEARLRNIEIEKIEIAKPFTDLSKVTEPMTNRWLNELEVGSVRFEIY